MATINTRVKADAKEFRVEMKAVANAIKEMSAQISKADETTGLFNKKVSKITGDFAHLTQGIAGSFAIVKDLNSLFGGVTSTFLSTADEIANLNSRLKLASASTAEYISQQKALLNIANSSYSKLSDTTDLYIKMAQGLKPLGYELKEINAVTASFSKALQLGGASAAETSSAILQFSQAIGSGVLRGQEFNAVAEASPKFMEYLAKGLDRPIGQLRKMAEAGELTADAVSQAILKMGDAIERDFATLPKTIERATTQLKNEAAQLANELNQSLNITGAISDGISGFNELIKSHNDTIQSAAKFVKDYALDLAALVAAFKAAPIAMKAFNAAAAIMSAQALPQTKAGFIAASLAIGDFKGALVGTQAAFKGLMSAFKGFVPTLVIFGTMELLYKWLNKDADAANALTNALALTNEQIKALSKNQALNELNKIDETFSDLSKQWADLNHKVSAGSNLLGFKYDEKEITAFKAQMDEINAQITKLADVRKQVASVAYASTKEINNATAETAKSVGNSTLRLKNQIDEVFASLEKSTQKSEPSLYRLQQSFTQMASDVALAETALKAAQDSGKYSADELARASDNIAIKKRELLKLEQDIANYGKENSKEQIKAAKELTKAHNDALNAQENYYKAIKDYASANAITLAKYEQELTEQVKAHLISKEQAYEMLAQKRIELEKDTNEQVLALELKQFDELIDHYKIIGDYAKAHSTLLEKSHKQALALMKNRNITSKQEADAYFKYFENAANESYEKLTGNFEKATAQMSDTWANMVSSMAKNIEDGLFNFIMGKGEATSFKGLLNSLGDSMLSSLISPFAKSISQGVGGIFNGILGGGNLANVATKYGLELDGGAYKGQINGTAVEILTDGTITKGGAVFKALGLSDETGEMISGALDLAQGVKSGIDLITNGIYNSVTNITAPISNLFGRMGLQSAGAFVSEFGAGAANALDFTSYGLGDMGFFSAFKGGTSMGLGALAGGAGMGFGIGSLGDMLFGAKTHASTGGAAGGLIGSAILPGIGTAIGSILGSVIGGMFGTEWKEIDHGISIKAPQNLTKDRILNYFNTQSFTKEEKKSWFGSDERTNYSNMAPGVWSELNATIVKLNTLLDGVADGDLLLNPSDYGINWDFHKEMMMQTLASFGGVYAGTQWQAWYKGYEAEEGAKSGEALKNLIEHIKEFKTTLQTLRFDKEPLKAMEYAKDLANSTFLELGKSLGAFGDEITDVSQLTSDAMAQLYEKGYKAMLTPANAGLWNDFANAYNTAKQAMESYLQALRQFSQGVYNAMISIRGAYGQNTSVLQVQMLKSSFNMLNAQTGAGMGDLASAAERFRNMNYKQMSEFLSYDTENRTQLIQYATQYAQIGTQALKEVESLVNNYKTQVSQLNAQIKSINANLKQSIEAFDKQIAQVEQSLSTTLANIDKQIQNLKLQNQADTLKAELAFLQAQQKIIKKFKSIADELRLQVYDAPEADALYKNALKQAKADFKAGNADAESYSDLQKAANKRAQNLAQLSATAEQYKYAMLEMANEIETLAPKDVVIEIEKRIAQANKELKAIEDQLGTSFAAQLAQLEHNRQSAINNAQNQIAEIQAQKQTIVNVANAQIAAINEQKSALLSALNDQIAKYQSLFNELGGTFREGFNNLVSSINGLISAVKMANKEERRASSGGGGSSYSYSSSSSGGGGSSSSYTPKYNTPSVTPVVSTPKPSYTPNPKSVAELRYNMSTMGRYQASIARAQRDYAAARAKDVRDTRYKVSNVKLPILNIKRYAEGGIVTKPTNALIGEAGYPEAVVPLKSGKIPIDFQNSFTGLNKGQDKQAKLLAKIATDIHELNYTLRNVTDGERLFMRAI